MKIPTTGNQVKFLLDGENFFRELTQQLDNVIKAKPSAGTYIRMAFWEVDAACWVDRSLTPRTLGTMLHAAADAGHNVQLISWKPRGIVGPLLSLGWKLPPPIPNYRSDKTHVVGERSDVRGRLEVYREEHMAPFFGTSNHQKIVIVSIDGVLTALVGGINLTDKSFAHESHDPNHQSTGLIGSAVTVGAGVRPQRTENWHDTAVRLTGPAANAVEDEWLRRWKKRRPWSRAEPVKAPKQASAEGGHAVTILTTNLEGKAREMHIREALCERISRAERYVYLENYTLSDPIVVAALERRLRSNKDLAVLYVTGNDYYPYNVLNRMTLLRLVIAAGGAGTLKISEDGVRTPIEEFRDREVVGGDFSDPFRVDKVKLLGNKWLEKDVFHYKTPEGKPQRIALGKIYHAECNRVVFAFPNHAHMTALGESIYVHSKLVLVDDDTAFIGSANLSYRSLVYDGEMCACIAGAAAKEIRVALFRHFNLDYADAAAIQAAALSGTFRARLATARNRPADVTSLVAFGATDYGATPRDRGDHTWH